MPGKLMLETSALSSWERIILVVIIPRIVLGINSSKFYPQKRPVFI